MPRDTHSKLVFSTDKGRVCPSCSKAVNQCQCKQLAKNSTPASDGIVRIRRETSGRGGKAVTTISGIALPADKLSELAKTLKTHCGAGGAVKDGIIEIQGDHREKLRTWLETKGYTVKLAGG